MLKQISQDLIKQKLLKNEIANTKMQIYNNNNICSIYYSQSHLQTETKIFTWKDYSFDNILNNVRLINNIPLDDLKLPFIESSSKDLVYKVQVFQKGNKTSKILIFKDDLLKDIIQIKDQFEFIYDEEPYGTIQWNQQQNKVVFLAEQKFKETKFSELCSDFDKNESNYLEQNQTEQGYHWFIDHWYKPELFIIDLESSKLEKFQMTKELKNQFIFQETVFGPNESLLVSVIPRGPIQQSLVYCYNRKKKLLFFKDPVFTKELKEQEKINDFKFLIDEELFTLVDLKQDQDYNNFYFVGRKEVFYEHNTCFQLYWLNLNKCLNQEQDWLELLIDTVEEPDNSFAGIYKYFSVILKPSQIYIDNIQDQDVVIFTSLNKDKSFIYIYFIKDKQLLNLTQEIKCQNHQYIQNVQSGFLLALEIQNGVELTRIINLNNIEYNNKYLQEYEHQIKTPFYQEIKALLDSSAFLIETNCHCQALLLRQNKIQQKTPLFVQIHGGPFSSSLLTKYYSFVNQTLLDNGISILLVNYEGSTGYGLKSIQNLVGKAGQNDVIDCKNLIKKTLELHKDYINEKELIIYGGSHGGFLTAHLVGDEELRDQILKGIILNGVMTPVTLFSTNILDWPFACLNTKERDLQMPISDNDIVSTLNILPLQKIKKIKGKIMVIVGEQDKTVDYNNGKYYYQALKFNNIDAEYVTYKNDWHQMRVPETSISWVLNMLNFILKERKIE